MEITDVRIFLRGEAKLKAYATVTFDSAFVVHNMRVIDGVNGFFVAMPSRKKKDGSHQDVAHPITSEMRKKIEDTVLAKYKETLAEKGEESPRPAPSSQDPKPSQSEVPAEENNSQPEAVPVEESVKEDIPPSNQDSEISIEPAEHKE